MSLNDPQWGRSAQDKKSGEEENREAEGRRDQTPENTSGEGNERNEGNRDREARPQRKSEPEDLDQLWNDLNDAVNSILGGRSKREQRARERRFNRQQNRNNEGGFGFENQQGEEPRNEDRGESGQGNPFGRKPSGNGNIFGGSINIPPAGFGFKGIAAACAIAIIGWCASGIYIVPEGQVGVVTTFGRYTGDSSAGINWRMPWPIQSTEIVDVSRVRKAEVGMFGGNNRLREALMLTDDENIVDVQFNVQYRIKPHAAKDYLFRTRNPDQSVTQAAESAMREVVGRKKMDSVLFESKQEIAESVKNAMQAMLDRYETGIEVMSVAIQNAQPPEQVQAAFNDAVKAGQDRERQINEGQAYANAVIPKAKGLASRLSQEAEGYKTRVVETAIGDTERFAKVLEQYEKAPEVTRDRMYVDAMREIYSNTKKVLVENKNGSNLLYLPFDKLMEKSAEAAPGPVTAPVQAAAAAVEATPEPSTDLDPRTLMRLRGR